MVPSSTDARHEQLGVGPNIARHNANMQPSRIAHRLRRSHSSVYAAVKPSRSTEAKQDELAAGSIAAGSAEISTGLARIILDTFTVTG